MNKQIVIVAVAGLLTGLGGGTGFKVMTAPPPAEATEGEHAAADSTGVHGEDAEHAMGDSATATDGEHSLADGHAPADSAAGDHPTATTDHATADPATDPVAAASHDSTDAEATEDEATAALGRLLGAMRPEEAARILEPLTDEQVRKVLFSLPERKAAAILAKFKGDRAAALARAIIEHAGTP